ncbi:MAG: lamin tail domain-containing protein, partial [Planctomycetota bacterium]|nr:lamin tail domain-containing protein [Planctomycetota bacterium]
MLGHAKISFLAIALTAALTGFVRAECPSGDLNGDCRINLQDLGVLAGHWLDPQGGPGDLNSDGKVDVVDLKRMADNWLWATVVINEIHYNPDVKTELVEFVELHNPTAVDVNISGWYFSDGISYKFPPGTILKAGGYIIVAQDPCDINTKWNSGRWPLVPLALVFGPCQGQLSNEGERIKLCNAVGGEVDEVDYQLGFPWPTVGDPQLVTSPGSGHSIQLVNPFFDNDLAGSWRSALPTPAARNSGVYRDNIPPHIRQVKHSPKQPKSGQVVTITAKVTDPHGIAGVLLNYQLVDPGNYISLNDSRYQSEDYWTSIEMHDDGLNGDQFTGDDIYTVQLPGILQTHRRLVRYRI